MHPMSSDTVANASTLRRQTDRLETLNEIGRVMSSTLDLQTLYETIYQQIGRVMDASQFFIALHREEEGIIEVPYLREEGALTLDQVVPFGESMTSTIIRTGTPILFHTTEEYDGRLRAFGLAASIVGEKDSESGIFVPLNTGSRTIGALTVQSTRAHAYTIDDMQMLNVLASQAAVAIENAGLYERSQRNVRETEALLQVAQTITGSLDLQLVLDSILTSMRDVIPYYVAAIFLPNHAQCQLEIVGTIGPLAQEWRESVNIPFGHGVTGKVFETGEPSIVNQVHSFPGYIALSDEVNSEMAVPLIRGDSVVGVISVERLEVNGFSPGDLGLLSLFASQATIAIENARLYAEQQKRVVELQAIQNIVQKLTPLHDVSEITDVINSELKLLIDYHACRVSVLDEESMLTQIPPKAGQGDGFRVRIGEGINGWLALHKQSVSIPNTLLDDRVLYIPGTPLREESVVGAPLIYEGRVRGVITLSKLGIDQFDENSLRLLEIIAAQTAIAFDRARLYAELRTEAVTDPLTRLYNRRYLLDRLKEERSRALRNHHTLLAIMLDIDRFKAVNDRYGHDAGDVVLVELAQLLQGVMRAEDVVARYGGEEFCLLVPEIPEEDAQVLAERLRQVVEEHEFPDEAGTGHITVSVGIAAFHPDDAGSELVTRADLAMYGVKATGGNGVCFAEYDGCLVKDDPAGITIAS
jgi:diguanylate cyclase (GGDEF)-like protein